MSSSNPFRKKTLQAGDAARAQSPAKSSLRSDSPRADDKPKPVKKVRVLSPPPLSPDSPEWSGGAGGGSEGNAMARDPFNGAAPAEENDAAAAAAWAVPPANPFSKTLHDLENSKELEDQRKGEGAALKAGNAARQSLNVDSFRRLLMTGKAGEAELLSTQDSRAPAASCSRDDASGEDLSNSPTSSDDSYSDGGGLPSTASPSRQKSKEKKMPPPPPNSRHGKTLRDDHADAPKLSPQTDVNKPVPPSPVRRSDDSESPLDRESAGKAPGQEPDLQHRVPAAYSRKLAPAPPPRRGHARTESRSQTQAPSSADEAVPRTSADETPSRQTGNAPTPPPPRRPHATPRQTSHTPSQSFSTAHATQAPSPSTHQHDSDHSRSASFELPTATPTRDHVAGSIKLVSPPPPPPPARHSSVRRAPSVHSVEGTSKRVSGEARARDGVAPPPPPRRQRGSSFSSIDVTPWRTSAEGASRPVLGERLSGTGDDGAASGGGQAAADGGKGVDILADLDALQREVDALRGKLG